MNKREKDCLEKGETFTFEDEDLVFEVSAVLLSESADIEKDKNKGNKVAEEGIMPKKEDLGNEKVVKKEEGLLEEEVKETETPKEEAEAPEEETEVEEAPEDETLEEEAEVETEASEDEEGMEDEAVEALEEESSKKKPPKPPRDPDPCPGVSPKEHWPMLRNRFFVILIAIVLIGAGFLVWYLGSNNGEIKAFAAVPEESVATEVTTAGRVMPVEVIYYTGVDENWMSSKEYEFDFNENSPILWIYRQAGVLYYDVECKKKVPFSPKNGGIIRNANSTLGPVTLSDSGDSWIVDETGEEVVFFSGYNTSLDATSGGFTEAAQKKTSEQVSGESLPVRSSVRVSIPEYSEVVLYYNTGSGWDSMPVSQWDGDTSSFEYWNFGTNTNSNRYWDVDLNNPVPSDNPGNYFWGQDGKKCWNGSSIESL